MKTYNIAVIGGGFMGRTHSCCVQNLKFYYDCNFRARLHTLCGRDASKTQLQAQRYGFLHAATDFDSVISNPDIDIVDICTPNPLHFAQAKTAILAGKHVYCDKPLAVTADEAYELAELAKRSGKVCQVVFQHRFWPAVIRAKQIIGAGGIGDIISIRAAFLHSSLVDGSKPYAWRNAPVSEGGGVLNDLGSHILDLIMYLCGDIESISAVTRTLYPKRSCADKRVKITSDDAAYMILRLKNGACGTAEASKLATGLNDSLKIEIHGKAGALMFDLAHPGELKYFSSADAGAPYGGESGFKTLDCLQKYPSPCDFLSGANTPGWIRAHLHSYFCFLDNIESGREPSPSFADAARVQALIEQARKCRPFE